MSNQNQQTVPVAVGGLTGATSVSMGEELACAIGAHATTYCWGDNTYGELGNGGMTDSFAAVAVKGL